LKLKVFNNLADVGLDDDDEGVFELYGSDGDF
jgi:hypothetical protein